MWHQLALYVTVTNTSYFSGLLLDLCIEFVVMIKRVNNSCITITPTAASRTHFQLQNIEIIGKIHAVNMNYQHKLITN